MENLAVVIHDVELGSTQCPLHGTLPVSVLELFTLKIQLVSSSLFCSQWELILALKTEFSCNLP